MRRHLAPILALLVLAAFPAAAHTKTALLHNGALPSSLATEPEIALPAIVTEAEDRLEIFVVNRKLASGIFCFVVEPNIWETHELGGKSWQGHDYMHARYFNPNFARFLSVDPEYSDGMTREPQKWNRYSYVTNNPLRFSDPNGRDKLDVVNGFFNALVSNFGVTIRVDADNADYRRGQRGGDQAAVAIGGSLVAASPTISGGITIGTGGAGVVTVPIAAVAVSVGGMAVVNGGAHLMQSNGNEGSGNASEPEVDVGKLKRMSKKDIKKLGGEELTQELKKYTGKSKANLYLDRKTGRIYSQVEGGEPQWVHTIEPR